MKCKSSDSTGLLLTVVYWVVFAVDCVQNCEPAFSQTHSTFYSILPPATATADSAIGLEQLSANGQIFDGAQMVVRLSQLKFCQAFIL